MTSTDDPWQPLFSAKLLNRLQMSLAYRLLASGISSIAVKRFVSNLTLFALLAPALPGMLLVEESDDASTTAIIDRYLQATRGHTDDLRGASMEVEISAKIPKLKENGTLQALRKISKVGQITYKFLNFKGDNTVKNQVIVRYLQAESQSQGDSNIAITPENYKFKYRGQKHTSTGQQAHVFQLSPKKKKVGLFKGELWLDTGSYLPLLEKGRLVKNPSIFLKKVDFERAFAIRGGYSVPSHIVSTIDMRLIGKVELNINYSKFAQDTSTEAEEGAATEAAGLHLNLCQ